MISASQLSDQLAARTEQFCRTYLPAGRRAGNYWQVGNKYGDPGRSMAVRLQDAGTRRAGKWADRATHEYGDLLDLLESIVGTGSFSETCKEARRFLNLPEVSADLGRAGNDQEKPPSNFDQVESGRKLFSYGKLFKDTPVERYLRGRDISRFGPALKYHPRVFFRDEDGQSRQLPAMLAAVTDNDGVVMACARTWLDLKNNSVARIAEPKRVSGQLYGNAVRFHSSKAGGDIIAGEGIETVLSIGSVYPGAELAACLTATHLSLFDPPSSCTRLFIGRDNDDAGELANRQLRSRAEERGIEVVDLVPTLDDFNDDLRKFGRQILRENLNRQIMAAITRPVPWASLRMP
ncbi:toprim domain-containing protein (plasmid) [Martelella lutilitoris]|uniref:Toprim domain-containing protein n=2 Tax=Martelella TaxID=293088 RepID=A0A7T7KPC5_9HYPH|nr:toprim domain-containing protein [Martelella lutilitoris]QQM32899.1 toprim domain-containing protein [Martelella lutilitoris]QRX65153.1 toprim domain-containing protein [Dysgonomonadaceae bacterium zrk40]